jgi:hypothetical protein
MANYYSIVNIDDKEVYGLGTITSAKEKLPIMAEKLKGKKLCFYGDESYSSGEDRYETFFNNEDFGEPWGAEYFDKGEPSISVEDCEKITTLTREEFEIVSDKLEGKEVMNLYDEILKACNI